MHLDRWTWCRTVSTPGRGPRYGCPVCPANVVRDTYPTHKLAEVVLLCHLSLLIEWNSCARVFQELLVIAFSLVVWNFLLLEPELQALQQSLSQVKRCALSI